MGYNRKDLSVAVSLTQQKGYTMKEINAIDTRLRKLEYYTALNALAQETSTLSVRDATGTIERFKNGIFADPFNDASLSRTNDIEYSMAVDSRKSIARPNYNEIFINYDLLTSTSTNIKNVGRLALLDYDNEKIVANPNATTYRNCTEGFYKFQGTLQVYPPFDNNNTVTNAAPQNIEVDIAGAFAAASSAGAFKDISSVAAAPEQTGSVRQGLTETNYFSQKTTTTVSDVSVQSSRVTQDLGSFVKDVSFLPYMRARQVAIVAIGLKPNTILFPFFDGTLVTQYCAPAQPVDAYKLNDGSNRLDPTKITGIAAGQENNMLVQKAAYGSTITSDSFGNVYLLFNIPANTFRAGDRTFTLANANDLKATSAIITSAAGVYSSSSLAVTQQQLSFSVIQPSFTATTTSSVSTNTWTNTTVFPPPPPPPPQPREGGGGNRVDDPVGETFVIKDLIQESIPGVYLTQLGVYFQSKSASLGVTCYVSETTSGFPDGNRVLGRAYLQSSQVLTSSDSSAETVFTFETPILLQTEKTYAFYIEPEAANPDYNIWISDIGAADVLTGAYISQQPYLGVLVASSNGGTWIPYQSQDIKFNLYRAKFKATSGTAIFRNPQEEYLSLSNITRATSGVPISVGDVVYAANASNLSQILFTNNTIYPIATVKSIDEVSGVCILRNSNGRFTNALATPNYSNLRFYRMPDPSNTAFVSNTYLIANASINTIDDIIYHGLVPKYNVLSPLGTSVLSTHSGTSNSTNGFAKETSYAVTPIESLYLYRDYERVVRSYSNEIAQGGYGANGSSTFTVSLNSGNMYISPAIDLRAKTFNFIQNLINNDSTNEHTRYGNGKTRYISKIVTLNSIAEDFLVYITGYKPPGTSIEVYGKFFKSDTDPSQFDNKLWTKLSYKSSSQPQAGVSTQTVQPDSSPMNLEDYLEYTFGLPSSNAFAQSAYADPVGIPGRIPAGTLTYSDENGGVQRGFNQFAIKIVLLSSEPTRLPTMRDVRAIALQI